MLSIWTWKSPRANRAGGEDGKGQWAQPVGQRVSTAALPHSGFILTG